MYDPLIALVHSDAASSSSALSSFEYLEDLSGSYISISSIEVSGHHTLLQDGQYGQSFWLFVSLSFDSILDESDADEPISTVLEVAVYNAIAVGRSIRPSFAYWWTFAWVSTLFIGCLE